MSKEAEALIAEIERGLEGINPTKWECHDKEKFGDRSSHFEIEIWDEDYNILIGTEVRRAHLDGGKKPMRHIARMNPVNVRILLKYIVELKAATLHQAKTIARLTKERDDASDRITLLENMVETTVLYSEQLGAQSVNVGIALAASIIVKSHGAEVEAEELLVVAGLTTEAKLREIGIECYDLDNLRPVLDHLAAIEGSARS